MFTLWHVVPNMNCMLQSKRPKGDVKLVRPVKELIHHQSLSPVGNCLDGLLGHAVLVMHTDSTVGPGLLVGLKIILPLLGIKWMVVQIEMLELHTV